MNSLLKKVLCGFILIYAQCVYAAVQSSYKQKDIVLVIASYNNADWYERNLQSVLDQTYKNWRIIYIDDCSTDGTADLVEKFVAEHNIKDRVTLIRNTRHQGALANHYKAVHMCADWEIVCQYDGDDWFTGNGVLQLINDTYQDDNIWITYGSFVSWPSGAMGYSKELAPGVAEKQLFRETYWTPGQLRTFYAWLFKKIKLEDFLWDHWDDYYGKFYPAACDLALSYPMMEMAGKDHYKYIEDVIYVHNKHTPLNDFKVNRIPQIVASNILLYKKKYAPLAAAPSKKTPKQRANAKSVDVIIFVANGIDDQNKVFELVDQCKKFVKPLNRILVAYLPERTIHEHTGQEIESRLHVSIKEMFLREMHDWWKSSEYVLFMDSRSRITQEYDVLSQIKILEETYAYAYFPSLRVSPTAHPAPCAFLNDQICAWRLCYLDHYWVRGPTYFNVLMHKKNIRERITYLDDELIQNSLLKNVYAPGMLMIQDGTVTRIGLCGVKQNIVD